MLEEREGEEEKRQEGEEQIPKVENILTSNSTNKTMLGKQWSL